MNINIFYIFIYICLYKYSFRLLESSIVNVDYYVLKNDFKKSTNYSKMIEIFRLNQIEFESIMLFNYKYVLTKVKNNYSLVLYNYVENKIMLTDIKEFNFILVDIIYYKNINDDNLIFNLKENKIIIANFDVKDCKYMIKDNSNSKTINMYLLNYIKYNDNIFHLYNKFIDIFFNTNHKYINNNHNFEYIINQGYITIINTNEANSSLSNNFMSYVNDKKVEFNICHSSLKRSNQCDNEAELISYAITNNNFIKHNTNEVTFNCNIFNYNL